MSTTSHTDCVHLYRRCLTAHHWKDDDCCCWTVGRLSVAADRHSSVIPSAQGIEHRSSSEKRIDNCESNKVKTCISSDGCAASVDVSCSE